MRTQPRTSPILAGLTLGLMTLSTAFSAELPAALDVHRAVGVSWQTEDGHQYQVEATTDLQTWGPVGPVVTGDGKSRTHYDDAANPGTFYRVKTIPGLSPKWFPGLKELLTESASVTGSGSSLELRNLRLSSESVSFDDLVHATFRFDGASQSFQLDSYSVSPGVGVFFDPYLAKHNSTVMRLNSGASEWVEETTYSRFSIPAGGVRLTAQLGVGHAPVFWFDDLTGDAFFRLVERPDGEPVEIILPKTTASIYTSPRPITTAGRYTWELVPLAGNALTCRLWFHNANRNPIETLRNGSAIGINLGANREYFKFQVQLEKNQVLTVSQPSNKRVRFTLVTSKSTKGSAFTGLPLNYRALESGTHYLFIDHADGVRDVSYSGIVTIGN